MENTKFKTGVLIVNLGTPDSPSVADVRKYLREFLMDRRVIDIPVIARFLLVNFIIAPFRGPKSSKVYKELWTKDGSPLKFYGERVEKMLQESLGEEYIVNLGMRYQSPSLQSVLEKFHSQSVKEIIVLPLFPQYASASTGSVFEKVMDIVKTWDLIPSIKMIDSYPTHPSFIKSFVKVAEPYLKKDFDHYLFSYHGLPERQITKSDLTGKCLTDGCCDTLHSGNRLCYRAQCFATTKELAKELNLKPEQYTVAFQSRLLKDPWIKPYSDDIIKSLPKENKKKVLVFVPSFVADCLETTIEVGDEYKELFEEHGGEHWEMVESLNDNPIWVECLKGLVINA